jgi:hypothetical protein
VEDTSVSGVIKGSVPMFEMDWSSVFVVKSDKSSDQYLSTLEDVTEGRTEELNCET